MEKEVLKVTGGKFTVKVFNGGKLVATYQGNGYVWFEMDKNGRHTGAVLFKDERGRIVRVGSFGGTVIVEYE
jgi:TRAP-type mannitol/chloroaromatic compound transport system substrate-binding protein